jgi:ABC-2 type transport system permease protein
MITSLSHFTRSLSQGFWLGWQIESNWARPWLFVLYTLVKPVTGTLLLVFMFRAAALATGTSRPELLAFAYLGNAAYMLVGAVGVGMTTAVVQDRESYGMLRYIRVSPVTFEAWLIGRGLAVGARALIGALWTVALGLLLPVGLRELLDPARIDWAGLGFALAAGLILLVGLGLLLASAVLNMARHGAFLGEGVGSALYLLSGAIFPLAVLPGLLQGLAMILPPTLWLEAIRRALLNMPGAGPLETWSLGGLRVLLVVSSLILLGLGWTLFRYSDRLARQRGRYDLTTGF